MLEFFSGFSYSLNPAFEEQHSLEDLNLSFAIII
jgi:hypothetical protein